MKAFQRAITEEVKRTGQVQWNATATWSFVGCASEDPKDIADTIAARLRRKGIYADVCVCTCGEDVSDAELDDKGVYGDCAHACTLPEEAE